MSFVARIEQPQQDQRESEVEFAPVEGWTTEDMIMAAQRMRELVPEPDDWSWGYERGPQGVVITVRTAGGTVITSAPLNLPVLVVPANERPHWFGDPYTR